MLRRHFICESDIKPDYIIYYQADEEICIKDINLFGLNKNYILNDYSDIYGDNNIQFKIVDNNFNNEDKLGYWGIKVINKDKVVNYNTNEIAFTAYNYLRDNNMGGGHGANYGIITEGLDYNDGGKAGNVYDKRYKITKIIIPKGIKHVVLLVSPILTLNNNGIINATNALQEISLPNTLKTIGVCTFMGCKIPIIKIPNTVENIHVNAFAYTESVIECPLIPPNIKTIDYHGHTVVNLFGENDDSLLLPNGIKSTLKFYPYSRTLYFNDEDWSKYRDIFEEKFIDNTIVVINGSVGIDTAHHFPEYISSNHNGVRINAYRYKDFYKIVGRNIFYNQIFNGDELYINANFGFPFESINLWNYKKLFLLGGNIKFIPNGWYYPQNKPTEESYIEVLYYNAYTVNIDYASNYFNKCIFKIKHDTYLEIGKDAKVIPNNFLYIENDGYENMSYNINLSNVEIIGEHFIQSDKDYDVINVYFGKNLKNISNYSFPAKNINIFIEDINDIVSCNGISYGFAGIIYSGIIVNIYINNTLLKNKELIIEKNINNPIFKGIKNLSTVDIKLTDDVTYIYKSAFSDTNINSIDLNKVEYIDQEAFSYSNINEPIYITKTVKNIGSNAFSSCVSNIIIENIDTLEYVGADAFRNTNIDTILTDDIVYLGKTLYKYNNNPTEIICKDNIKYVNVNNIPDSVENIQLPEGIEKIFNNTENSSNSFIINENSNFMKNQQDNSIIYINNYCVCTKNFTDTIVNIKEGTILIAQNTFANKFITNINLPESLLYINDGAFRGCNRLEIFNLPNNLKSIGDFAFYGTFLHDKTITIPNSVIYIGYAAFSNSGVSKLILSDNIEILNSCFISNKYIHQITLPKKLKYITAKDFKQCSSLRYIYYNNTIENWYNVKKDTEYWYVETEVTKIICTDGEINLY